MAITWGSIVGSYGRIGVDVVFSDETATSVKATFKVYFWSKYSVSDSSNTLYFDYNTSTASTDRGSKSISTSVSSGGGWSTSNQKLIYTSGAITYSKGTSAQSKSCAAKLTGIDRVGGTMTVSKSFTIAKKTSYTVSYNANGGSGAPGAQTKWHGTNLTLSSTKPTRTGYTFQGWGTSTSDTSVDYKAGATYSANASDTLYAIWKANTYAVKYDANGGSGAPSAQTKTYGVALTLSNTKPTRTNYTFKGWGTSKTSTTVAYAAGANYTANSAVTLYAIWELAYTKPRITNIKIERGDSSGSPSVEGTYGLVSFSWATDKTVSSIKIEWKPQSETSYPSANVKTVTASGTSGTVTNELIGGGALSIETSYDIRITVTDASGNTPLIRMLTSMQTVMDFKAGGKGIGFGKIAEEDNMVDSSFRVVSRYSPSSNDGEEIQFHAKNSVNNTNTGFKATRTDTGVSVWTGIGSGGANHGLFSEKASNWMIYVGSDGNTYLASGDDKRVYTRNLFGFYSPTTNNPEAASITVRWADSLYHDLLSRSAGGLATYVGPGDIKQNTITYLRGQNVRLYAHSGGGVYLGSSGSTAITSDRNLKKDIFELSDKYSQFFNRLRPVSYKYSDNGHRDHIGYIAQEVEEALISSGLTTEQFAGICIEKGITLNPNEDSSLTDEERKANETHYDELYSLRYEEFIALNTLMIQKANRIIEEQQEQIEDLKNRLTKLEKLVGGVTDNSAGNT